MQNGPKTIMNARPPRPAASFAARPKRWTSSATHPEPKSSQNAQRSYERYLALARADLPVRRTLFQIDALGLKTDVRDFAVMAACGQGAGGDKLRSVGRRTLAKKLVGKRQLAAGVRCVC